MDTLYRYICIYHMDIGGGACESRPHHNSAPGEYMHIYTLYICMCVHTVHTTCIICRRYFVLSNSSNRTIIECVLLHIYIYTHYIHTYVYYICLYMFYVLRYGSSNSPSVYSSSVSSPSGSSDTRHTDGNMCR
jgi:hypothetical protein